MHVLSDWFCFCACCICAFFFETGGWPRGVAMVEGVTDGWVGRDRGVGYMGVGYCHNIKTLWVRPANCARILVFTPLIVSYGVCKEISLSVIKRFRSLYFVRRCVFMIFACDICVRAHSCRMLALFAFFLSSTITKGMDADR